MAARSATRLVRGLSTVRSPYAAQTLAQSQIEMLGSRAVVAGFGAVRNFAEQAAKPTDQKDEEKVWRACLVKRRTILMSAFLEAHGSEAGGGSVLFVWQALGFREGGCTFPRPPDKNTRPLTFSAGCQRESRRLIRVCVCFCFCACI
jgi:hypothetical protein